MLFLQLCKSQRCGQPSGAAADDQDVDVEGFALHERTNFIRAFEIFVDFVVSLFPELGDERGHDLEQIADDAVVGDLEDGGVRILIDGNNRPRPLHPDEVLDRS